MAAVLTGVAFAQLTTPNTTSTPYSSQTTEPWCVSNNPQATTPYCYNSAVNTPAYCYSNSATNGLNLQGCHGYGIQGTSQYYGVMSSRSMMGEWGMNGRGW